MPSNRRSFLLTSGAAVCVAALSQGTGLAAPFTKKLGSPLLASAEETAVLAFVQSYASAVRLIGSGVLAKVRQRAPASLHFLVQVAEPARMDFVPATLAGEAAPVVRAVGNTVSFTWHGIDFALENCTPAEYAQRLAGLARPRNVAFPQDALSYEPGSLEVSDPFAALQRVRLVLVNPTAAGAAAVELALRGAAEGPALGLGESPAYTGWHRRSLNLNARAKDAAGIAGAFFRGLAQAGDTLTPEAVAAFLQTRLVATALRQLLGLDAAAVAAQFAALRAQLASTVTNSALWLALLLQPALDGSADDASLLAWAQNGSPPQNARARQALAGARAVLPLF